MPTVEPTFLTTYLRRMAATGAETLTDAELVGRYAEHRDAAAFEVLLWRHGPMVWAACCRILRHQHDIEDAFQATFLAFTRSAGSIRQAPAGWLHRVAVNAALKLKAQRRSTELTDEIPGRTPSDAGGEEFTGAVDEEIDRLPARCRAAFVLCCLEGMTNVEAARELGCPVGTVDSRLHAARARLRERLIRRGFGPGLLAGLGMVEPPLASMAAVIAGVPARPFVETLATEMSRIMTKGIMTMKIVTAALFTVAFAGAVWAFGGPITPPAPKGAPPTAKAPVTVEPTLPRPPRGILGDHPGEYLTIEGMPAETTRVDKNGIKQPLKIDSGTLLVDTVNGKKLEKPIPIVIRSQSYARNALDQPLSIDLRAKERCIFKGYESGSMIGVPPAIYHAAKEQGREDVPMSPAAWQWRPYFAALIVVQPKELELPRKLE